MTGLFAKPKTYSCIFMQELFIHGGIYAAEPRMARSGDYSWRNLCRTPDHSKPKVRVYRELPYYLELNGGASLIPRMPRSDDYL